VCTKSSACSRSIPTSFFPRHTGSSIASSKNEKAGYNRFLLLVAGLGGLLYGVDVGIIAGALPYLEATSGLNAGQLSIVVAAVLLGSVISTLFAGALADWIGRKPLMIAQRTCCLSAAFPLIALSHGYESLVLGRVLQGVSAGLIGVVVPLYLAECLAATNRGKGTGIFQWLLTLGIVTAAVVGMYFSFRVEEVARLGDPAKLFAFKDTAWRSIFWVSLPPGILFVIGSLMVSESPRWLFRRGQRDAAYAALLRSRTDEQADVELAEMENGRRRESENLNRSQGRGIASAPQVCDSVCPGLRDSRVQSGHRRQFHHRLQHQHSSAERSFRCAGALGLRSFHDREFPDDHRRRTAGGPQRAQVPAVGGQRWHHRVAPLHRRAVSPTEKLRVDARDAVQSMLVNDPKSPGQKVTLLYDEKTANALLAASGDAGHAIGNRPTSLVVIYSYGDFRAATKVARSDDKSAQPIEITRESCVPANKVVAFFSNPFSESRAARTPR
jgi:MFS transporter, SP family, solute carrier family 2 (myo-inositol transporter), member 13